MFAGLIKIVEYVTKFVSNLNLTKKDVVIILCVLGMAGTAWSASHYKSKANHLAAALLLSEKKLFIERDGKIIEDNEAVIKKIKEDNENKDKELSALYATYSSLSIKNNYIEELQNVKSIKDVCKEFSDMGYPICDGIIVDCGR